MSGNPDRHPQGIAGQKPDGAARALVKASELKAGEVPAILMRNEEVLRADDPRHRHNLGMSIVAHERHERAGSRQQGWRSRDARTVNHLDALAVDREQ